MNNRITFEIAKLLKEKGYNEPCDSWFIKDEYNSHDDPTKWINSKLHKDNYSRPTTAEVIMWLYEKHNIWLYVAMKPKEDGSEEVWFIPHARYIPTKTKNGFEIDPILYMCRKSPGEAYSAGIEYILKEML